MLKPRAGSTVPTIEISNKPQSTLWVTLNKKGKGKGRYSSSWEPHLRVTGRHLPYGITQCYLPPDTSERARLTPAMHACTRFTYPGGMEG